MSQDAGAGQSKRSQNPAYVYGPMVYQFPADREGEEAKEKNKSNAAVNFLIPFLVVLLVIGGVTVYLKEKGINDKRLSFRDPILERRIFRGASGEQMQSPVITRARVAADKLYLREGPGIEYVATYLLPQNWGVSVMGDYQTDNNGDVWARVLVLTDQGPQEGWVSRRFLE
jgi:hypothetical protein